MLMRISLTMRRAFMRIATASASLELCRARRAQHASALPAHEEQGPNIRPERRRVDERQPRVEGLYMQEQRHEQRRQRVIEPLTTRCSCRCSSSSRPQHAAGARQQPVDLWTCGCWCSRRRAAGKGSRAGRGAYWPASKRETRWRWRPDERPRHGRVDPIDIGLHARHHHADALHDLVLMAIGTTLMTGPAVRPGLATLRPSAVEPWFGPCRTWAPDVSEVVERFAGSVATRRIGR